MAGYSILSLYDIYCEFGEEKTKGILSKFSCPINRDVEYFLRKKALEFEKQSWSKTHLVYASYKGANVLVGYFTLSNKSISIKKSAIKYSWRKRLNKFADHYDDLNAYQVAIPLIAQLGKNFGNGYNKLITGDELLKFACDTVQLAQSLLGGRFVYLECEEKADLLEFYNDNGFVNFDKRLLDADERFMQDGHYLIQLIKHLEDT